MELSRETPRAGSLERRARRWRIAMGVPARRRRLPRRGRDGRVGGRVKSGGLEARANGPGRSTAPCPAKRGPVAPSSRPPRSCTSSTRAAVVASRRPHASCRAGLKIRRSQMSLSLRDQLLAKIQAKPGGATTRKPGDSPPALQCVGSCSTTRTKLFSWSSRPERFLGLGDGAL